MLKKLSTRHLFQQYLARIQTILFIAVCAFIAASVPSYGQQDLQMTINWDKTTVVSKSTPTLQVVVNPPLRHGEPLGVASYKAVKKLGADYVRYVPWLPYPRLAVAELEPPTPQTTSWDFSLIDPMTLDFLAATKGHPTVMNFSTMPAWLFKTDKPVTYPDDPNKPFWNYTQGTQLRDPSGKELGDYYERLVSWYVNGGFTDENGVWHNSGHHYKLPVWEVLNEVEFEHSTTPQDYTLRYDAIVEGIHRASPTTKFMGMALGAPKNDLDFVKYFLNPANHKPGIPIDYISYHFYATPSREQTIDDWQNTFFQQADDFLTTVHSIEQVRQQLSPETKTDLDELGVILPTDNNPGDNIPPPAGYYNAAGALYAYLYVQLSRMQIDIIGESQLVGYPTQYPSVSMMDWTNNKPNARYWVLKLITDNFHPGDVLVDTSIAGLNTEDVEAQAFVTSSGHKLLLVNKRNKAVEITLPDAQKASAVSVDETSWDDPARKVAITDGIVTLAPFAVTVVHWK
jgi:hypothetical protein